MSKPSWVDTQVPRKSVPTVLLLWCPAMDGPGPWAHWRLEEPSRKEGLKLTQTAEHTVNVSPRLPWS